MPITPSTAAELREDLRDAVERILRVAAQRGEGSVVLHALADAEQAESLGARGFLVQALDQGGFIVTFAKRS